VLAITLAVILTAILAIAVTICVLRRRAHTRRVFRAASESPGLPKADGKAVWGCTVLGDSDVELPNGRVRQASDLTGGFRSREVAAGDDVHLNQSPIRYSECNGRMTSFDDRKYSAASSAGQHSDPTETRLNQLQVVFSRHHKRFPCNTFTTRRHSQERTHTPRHTELGTVSLPASGSLQKFNQLFSGAYCLRITQIS